VEDEGLGNVIVSATGVFGLQAAGETVGTCVGMVGLDVTVVPTNRIGADIGAVETGAAGGMSGDPYG
jgi:hypothetical protein